MSGLGINSKAAIPDTMLRSEFALRQAALPGEFGQGLAHRGLVELERDALRGQQEGALGVGDDLAVYQVADGGGLIVAHVDSSKKMAPALIHQALTAMKKGVPQG